MKTRDAATISTESETENDLRQLLEDYDSCKEGSEERFIVWLRAYVLGVVKRSIRDSYEADDAAQEIVFKFHAKLLAFDLLKMLRNQHPVYRFLFVVVNHALCDIVRRISRRSRHEITTSDGELPTSGLADEAPDPCQQAIKAELFSEVRGMLLALEKVDQHLVMLHYGFLGPSESYSSIAARLGLKEKSARKRGYRAVLLLRKRLRL
jgi:RNA polymerase sigma factor (sigma-70 family)